MRSRQWPDRNPPRHRRRDHRPHVRPSATLPSSRWRSRSSLGTCAFIAFWKGPAKSCEWASGASPSPA